MAFGFFYFMMTVCILVLSTLLLHYHRSIAKATESKEICDIAAAIEYQQKFWKLAGVTVIVELIALALCFLEMNLSIARVMHRMPF